jgi:hypothetical protein
MGTVRGKTHIKMILSFWTGTGKHFIGNVLCSSDDSVTQLIHILHVIAINIVFYIPPEERIQRNKTNLENEGAREWDPFFLTNNQEVPCPERYEHSGTSEVLHYHTLKLFPQGHDAKQCCPS